MWLEGSRLGLFGAGLVVAACGSGADEASFEDKPLNSLSPPEQEQACDALVEERDYISQASIGPLCAGRAIDQALYAAEDPEEPLDEPGLRAACVMERDACLTDSSVPPPTCKIPEGCAVTLNEALTCYAVTEARLENLDDVPACETLTFDIARSRTSPSGAVTVSATCGEFSLNCRWASE